MEINHISNLKFDLSNIEEYTQKAEKLLVLLQQAKQLIGELSEVDLVNPHIVPDER